MRGEKVPAASVLGAWFRCSCISDIRRQQPLWPRQKSGEYDGRNSPAPWHRDPWYLQTSPPIPLHLVHQVLVIAPPTGFLSFLRLRVVVHWVDLNRSRRRPRALANFRLALPVWLLAHWRQSLLHRLPHDSRRRCLELFLMGPAPREPPRLIHLASLALAIF